MRTTLTRLGGVSAACIVLAVSTASADDLSRYREFELGSSVAIVTAVTRTAERDLKTLHSRPALLQRMQWQPRYMAGSPVADRESINEVEFSFVDDRLFKIVVTYHRDRTTGLTHADMVASLTATYGAPSGRPRPGTDADTAEGNLVLAEWRSGDAEIALQHSRYKDSFSLVITSLSLESVARKAQADAVVIDAREAPAREEALARKRADDARQAEEQSRATNKERFRP